MIARLLRAVFLASIGILCSWLVLEFVGPGKFVDYVAIRWRVPLYKPIFLSLLGITLAAYFYRDSSTANWLKLSIAGLLAGLVSGPVAALVAAGIEEGGGQSVTRGFEDSGMFFLLRISAVATFPFWSWLYGLLASLCGGLTKRYLMSRWADKRPTSGFD